ncbi:SDR family oxidoreductase [Mangrovicella endophytica]|uniref:SDR family oxidoreductase n=1 Tax=Mangrovicella endophytica TaxID=2066697 RepID=UPI000C9EB448|nr:SDR family oxidoreductase [Mangrovicella endophytica]
MRVFVTGATGFVGSAVVQELLQAGHQVLGLARTDAAEASLRAAGAEPHRGDINDLDSLRRGAAAADAVCHTAFNHDFSRFRESCEEDRHIVAALGSALEGSDRPLIVTSGIGVFPGGREIIEDDQPSEGASPRVATEQAVQALRAQGINAVLMRLPPSVHGEGDHGFVPILINLAREKGIAAYVGGGSNRWSAVHRSDAGRLYRLVLEGGATAAAYHAVAEGGMPFRDIAEVIGRRLGLPVAGLTKEEAAGHFGWFTHFAGLDMSASSRQTRELTGWSPSGPGLIEDIDQPYYFS